MIHSPLMSVSIVACSSCQKEKKKRAIELVGTEMREEQAGSQTEMGQENVTQTLRKTDSASRSFPIREYRLPKFMNVRRLRLSICSAVR